MANYDFYCDDCGELFEVKRSMNDSEDVVCPVCDALARRHIKYAPSVKYIGAGFASNDLKREKGSIFDAGQSHDLI